MAVPPDYPFRHEATGQPSLLFIPAVRFKRIEGMGVRQPKVLLNLAITNQWRLAFRDEMNPAALPSQVSKISLDSVASGVRLGQRFDLPSGKVGARLRNWSFSIILNKVEGESFPKVVS
jgi:hypothetical protein